MKVYKILLSKCGCRTHCQYELQDKGTKFDKLIAFYLEIVEEKRTLIPYMSILMFSQNEMKPFCNKIAIKLEQNKIRRHS